MPFDFPSAPTNGQQVTGSGGQVYTFDGTKWVATATAAGVTSWNTRTGNVTMSSGDVTTALTYTPYNATNPSGYQTAAQVTTALAPYAPLAAPVFTGDARAVTPAYGDNDTSIPTTAFVQSAVAPTANNVGRNRLHNVGFTVNQRGYTSGTALAAGAYGHDRWKGGASGCTYTFTQSYPTTTITITAGSLQQIVESIGVAGGTYTLSWTGTAQGRVNAGTYAASPVTAVGLPANTAITVEFNTGTVGSAQLEIGTQATQFDAGGSPQQILAECQRFYQTLGSVQWAINATASGQYLAGNWLLPVTMRGTPTLAFTGTSYSNASGIAANGVYASAINAVAISSAAGFAQCTTSFALSADL